MRRLWLPQIVVSLMLLWALNPDNQYSYYILLRWVCCAVFAYLACHAADTAKRGCAWTLGVLALIYNPIIPVHLSREIWSVVNLVSIGAAVASIFCIPRSQGPQRHSDP